jgi:lipoyl(octanoyl) transferase
MANQSIFKELIYSDLGMIDYKSAWDLQKKIFELRINNKIDDVLLLLEHPHTYTLGKVAKKEHLISSEKYVEENKIDIFEIDRGGDITYHGPGQVVGYPIINLNNWYKDSHKYLRVLEEIIILTCSQYGLKCERNPKYTGVWINDEKIAAIGVKISRWVTMHGFAFNVNTDLSFFNGIIPCGINDKSITSLSKKLDNNVEINEVKAKLLSNFKNILDYKTVSTLTADELQKRLNC